MPINLLANESPKKNAPINLLADESPKAKAIGVTPPGLIRDVIQGALTGAGRGGQLINQGLRKLPGAERLSQGIQRATGFSVPEPNINEVFSGVGSGDKSLASEFARGMGSYLPYGAAGGASLLGQVGAGVAHGAAMTNPGQENLFGYLPEGRAGGALEGGLLNLLIGGAFKGAEALRPSKMFRGNLSDKQLAKNLEITRGTETGLGDVIESPFLKRMYENVLPHVPFSGAPKSMVNTAYQVRDQGKNLLDEIGVGAESLTKQRSQLQEALKQASKQARQEKNQNFEKLNKMADEADVIVGRENFTKKAKDAIADIEQSPELKREFPADILSDLESYATNAKGNNLKLSNIFKGKLGDKANDLYMQGRMHEYGIVKDLQGSLQSDIDSAIEGSGHAGLKKQYQKSQTDYKEKFAPFEDADIVKFTRQGGDADLLLSHFIKTGSNDRSNLLSKLIDKLPQQSSRLPLQMYLSRAIEDGGVNPLTLRSLYNKLGESQKDVLIKDKSLKEKLKNYVDLVGKNTEPLTAMTNVKTGQRNLDAVTVGIMSLLGHGVAGNYGALASGALPVVAGKVATKALTSEKLRESLITEMLKNRSKFGKGEKPTQTLSQGLLEALKQEGGQ